MALKHGLPPFHPFEPRMLWYGTSEHLWFAPFAIVASVVAANAQSWWGGPFVARHIAVLIALGLLGAGLVGLIPLPLPFGQWVYALPSIPLGIALGVFAQSSDRALLQRAALVLALLAALAEFLAVPLDPATGESLRRYAVALPLVLACFLWPIRSLPTVDRFAAYVPGVYFIHILVRDIAHPIEVGGVIGAGAIVFALSLLLVEILQRTPLRGVLLVRESAKLPVGELVPAPAPALDAPPR